MLMKSCLRFIVYFTSTKKKMAHLLIFLDPMEEGHLASQIPNTAANSTRASFFGYRTIFSLKIPVGPITP